MYWYRNRGSLCKCPPAVPGIPAKRAAVQDAAKHFQVRSEYPRGSYTHTRDSEFLRAAVQAATRGIRFAPAAFCCTA